MLVPPEVTFYQENTPTFFLPTKWRTSCEEVTALPIIPTPPSPTPQVLSQLSSAAPHPHLGAERWGPGTLQHSCLGSGPWETSIWASLAWPGPGAGRNSNKPTEANPRDIPLWHHILTLTWPNLCLFRDQQTLLATYQETLLRSDSCSPPSSPELQTPLSLRLSTHSENKSLYGE